jgi:hypothetical protein
MRSIKGSYLSSSAGLLSSSSSSSSLFLRPFFLTATFKVVCFFAPPATGALFLVAESSLVSFLGYSVGALGFFLGAGAPGPFLARPFLAPLALPPLAYDV